MTHAPRSYSNPVYPYRRSPDQDRREPAHHRVVIAGGGMSGLAAALDLASYGIEIVVLDDNNTVSVGSRAICISKRCLEILDRLGCAERLLAKGVTWQTGRVFFREREIFNFDLLPEGHYKMPAFINLQQYYFEQFLVERITEVGTIDLRWQHKVTGVDAKPDGTTVTVETPEGDYRLHCDYLVAADGANSPIREMLDLKSKGQVFNDRFLIADILMKAEFPAERWFWFDPPFHPNQSVLLHRQADDIWRIDFQLGADADPDEELRPERIAPRIRAMLGEERRWNLEWASVYTFRCRCMDSFIHRRVIFVGDAAHQVSPFGARGGNGAIQGTENLSWKLASVLKGEAPPQLLLSYDSERRWGAAENILNSTRATDFITPKNRISRIFRDETLHLAEHYPFARALVNSGRLSKPCVYDESPLNSPDSGNFPHQARPGSVCPDAPLVINGEAGWLLQQLGGRFTLLINTDLGGDKRRELAQALNALAGENLALLYLGSAANLPPGTQVRDRKGLVEKQLELSPGCAYLIRPDQHIAARWSSVDAEWVRAAKRRALGYALQTDQAQEEAIA